MYTTKNSLVLGKVNSVVGYLRYIFKLEDYEGPNSSDSEDDEDEDNNERHSVVCYRGQSDSSWRLAPSISRGYIEDAENKIIRELILEAPNEFNGDKFMFDKLVRAQHYGLPTRLLDVSLNPLVALYFACCEYADERDGKVFIIRFKERRVKFADSDTISLISNLSRLSDEEKNVLRDSRKVRPSKFRELEEVERLVDFVKAEKPHFNNRVERFDLFRYFFVYPSKNNKRVIAQAGAFMSAGLLSFESPETSKGFDIMEVTIPAGSKEPILEELDKLNISSRTLFPEIEFASKYIKTKYLSPSIGKLKVLRRA